MTWFLGKNSYTELLCYPALLYPVLRAHCFMKGEKFVLGCDLLFPWKALMPLAAAATVFRLLNNRGRWVSECGRRRRRGGTAWKRSLLQCLIKVNLHALGECGPDAEARAQARSRTGKCDHKWTAMSNLFNSKSFTDIVQSTSIIVVLGCVNPLQSDLQETG